MNTRNIIFLVVVIVLLVFIGFRFKNNNMKSLKETFAIYPIEHATFAMLWDKTSFYVDPIGEPEKFSGQSPARVVLVTDIHGDHFSAATLEAVSKDAELIVVPGIVADDLPTEVKLKSRTLNNEESLDFEGFKITAVPMYNIPESENAFHVKGRGNGYLIEKDGFRVYIAGDTSGTPEMRALRNIDVAFVPMNLPYTMTVEEAADTVLEFKPKQVWPYHYRSQGGLSDVQKFKQLVAEGDAEIDVVLGDWYK